MFTVHKMKKKMVLCRQIKKCFLLEKNPKDSRWSSLKMNFAALSPKWPLFTQSGSSSEPRHIPRPPPSSTPLRSAVLVHRLGLVFQFQAGAPRLRPAGICSAARFHLNVAQRARKTSVPFFMYDPRSFQDLLLWFTSLFLFWGRISASKDNKKIKKQNVTWDE